MKRKKRAASDPESDARIMKKIGLGPRRGKYREHPTIVVKPFLWQGPKRDPCYQLSIEIGYVRFVSPVQYVRLLSAEKAANRMVDRLAEFGGVWQLAVTAREGEA